MADPLSAYKTGGELAALAYHLKGEDGLRELLTILSSGSSREYLEKTAGELRMAGLSRASEIVMEFVATAISKDDNPYNKRPYTDNPAANELNIKQWREGRRKMALLRDNRW